MNAGIADATNLSWQLAAHLNGWAPVSILDAYEAERWPITSQVSRFAMSHAEAEIRRRGAVPEKIEDAGSEGEFARAEIARLAYEMTCSNMSARDSTSAPTMIARRSSESEPKSLSKKALAFVCGDRFHQRHQLTLHGLVLDLAVGSQQPQTE
jgi:2-polyprenyl-6-methoxyphenol hydroxylase-like FAD-dependent oxidoreductase